MTNGQGMQMLSATEYTKLYGQAHAAYCQGKLEEATTILERMVQEFPDDPNLLLLQGHIYLSLRQADLACRHYELVLQLSDQKELIDCAQQGLVQAQQLQPQGATHEMTVNDFTGVATNTFNVSALDFDDAYSSREKSDALNWEAEEEEQDWEEDYFSAGDLGEPTLSQAPERANPFSLSRSNRPDPSDNDIDHFEDTGALTFGVSSELGGNSLLAPNPPSDALSGNSRGSLAHLDPISQSFNTELLPDETALDLDDSVEDLESLVQLDRAVGGAQELTNSGLFSLSAEEFSTSLGSHQKASHQFESDETDHLSHLGSWAQTEPQMAAEPTTVSGKLLKPVVEVQQGKLAFFENASLRQKQWMTATAAGIASALTVLVVSATAALQAPKKATQPAIAPFNQTSLMMALVGGLAGFGTTLFLGQIATNQIKRNLDELQAQFDALQAGNLNVKATIHSSDELGQAIGKFNQISRVLVKTTSEAQRRASQTEQAKEDLQRQVIRLLDDVEGAARGDLTVEAKVTADVLGAVADAFNLTIQNLREIVRQVKKAAQQVNKGSTDSESYARNQSSDALRMAEELAVTLNSVQMLTDSIQRVAENAREAEEVARSSSVTALKGGESVERTVVGILQIRETVSETARKVKRLAEASQEISKIVALISQIASRTNLLALNASIQAAKAGEAGRGFAIVADEVRQLADRSAKSLREIEQIVLQIQSETGSVMIAMEEAIQQVLDVTDKSEQAKRSLEDIIEVSNHIDKLVGSITADTVKQRENSLAVAQVMQSVELTAQETSKESQRVASSLQNLVGISRDLLSSVERFRID
jgi:twitching motility protein PilJ